MIYFINATSGNRIPADATDIAPITGILNFIPGQMMDEISLGVQDDSIPELSEMFQVELSITSIEGAFTSGRLGNTSTVLVIVGESDEPNGVLMIADASTTITIAEDIPLDNVALGQAQILVDRIFGTIGAVEALWEITPLSDIILPDYVDLLFFGEHGAGVALATPRPNTATAALRFSGQSGSIVTVPSQYHPTNISSGFTIRLVVMIICLLVKLCTY